jgi:carboxyl-terminal processing protease
MRPTSLVLCCLLAQAPLFAGSITSSEDTATVPPARGAELYKEARDFAEDLQLFLEIVHSRYVREIPKDELLEAAMVGLYEAAQIKVPADLHKRLTETSSRHLFFKLNLPEKSIYRGNRAFQGFPRETSTEPQPKVSLGEIASIRLSLGDPESLRGKRALFASVRGMIRVLDPYCSLVTEEEAMRALFHEENTNFGLALDKTKTRPLVIGAVAPGGPAQKAGLRPGDVITHIDDEELGESTSGPALKLLAGQQLPTPRFSTIVPVILGPDSVKLTIRPREGGRSRTLSLKRETFELETILGVARNRDNSWNYWIDRNKRIAHVRISTFRAETGKELRTVLERLDGDGGIGGIILDFRWTLGGSWDSVMSCAGVFLNDRDLMRVKYRDMEERTCKASSDGVSFPRIPLVVLVNGDTAGGAEVIAAALQDHKLAVIVGERTHGQGSVQEDRHVELQGASLVLKLTVATFTRPNSKALYRFPSSKPSDDWGVRPDEKLECVLSPALNRQLREWWDEQTLRPGSSNKALPLDDPDNDPQRQAALKALLRQMK